jgi:hypothetical protein
VVSQKPSFVAVTLVHARPSRSGHLGYDPYDVGALSTYVKHLERIGVAFVMLGASPPDTEPVRFRGEGLGLEVFTLASYLAVETQRIGIVPRVNINYLEPFAIARLIASLDHVSDGRAGWYASTEETRGSASNHRRAPSTQGAHSERANEFIRVVERLFDSWDADAFIRDKESGRFVDPERVRVLDHRGQHYAVKGPLNVARSPQGRPPRLWGLCSTDEGETMLTPGEVALVTNPGDVRARGQCTVWRIAPFIADRIEDAHALAESGEGAQGAHHDIRFVGTWAQWRAEVARCMATAQFDGLLLELPAAKAIDPDYVSRLVDGLIHEDDDSFSSKQPTLRERFGLPPSGA